MSVSLGAAAAAARNAPLRPAAALIQPAARPDPARPRRARMIDRALCYIKLAKEYCHRVHCHGSIFNMLSKKNRHFKIMVQTS